LIAPNKKEELYGAIKGAIGIDDETLMKMKKRSLEKIRTKFLWKKIADQTISEISKLVKVEAT